MSPVEYAWTSFKQNAGYCEFNTQDFGGTKDKRFHPTQKPIALYEWLLTHYAEKGQKILDTHCGSASSLIACHNLDFDAWGYEIDREYFEKASRRLSEYQAQIKMNL